MATPSRTERRDQTQDGDLRRRLLLLAGIVSVLALLHFVDHVIRGEFVASRGLNPDWNHSGWPFFTDKDDPYIFTASFVIVSLLLVPGILLTLRGKLWAGFWLATSVFLIALLVFVHFIGSEPGSAETPSVIAMTYPDTFRGILALSDLFGLFAVLAALAYQAVRTRQLSGRW